MTDLSKWLREGDSNVVALQTKSYRARSFAALGEHMDFYIGGTLCGHINLAIAYPTRSMTHVLSVDEAVALANALLGAARDVRENCLGDRDPLLRSRQNGERAE